jgi:UDP-GlcNAc:undecaprenyl-phosphate GlcNAc-1-phosphate transferase
MIYTEFLIISFFSIICCFLLIFFARKFDLIDYPTKRKKHKFPTPYIGGLVIGIGCLIILNFFNLKDSQLQSLLLCSFLMSLIGLMDDKFELNVLNKFILQSIPVLIVISKKLFINNLGTYEYFGLVSLGIFSVFITFLCVIFLMNAANYNDGINGNLISIFITFLFIIINFVDSNNTIFIILLLFIPIAIILFFFNCIIKKEFTLFLGDSGSLTIGFLISFICIYCAQNNLIAYALIPWTINYLVFEFISTNVSRVVKNKNVFNAGDDHMHYILKKIFVKNYLVITIINFIYLLNFLLGFLIFKIMGSAASIIFFVIFFFIYFYIREKIFREIKL